MLSSRAMWALLSVVFIAVLAIGSYHPSKPTEAQRIANLESVLKCPSCAEAPLSQSETVGANQLKAIIVQWVYQGISDQAIESRLVASYGPGELLRPVSPFVWIVPAVTVAVAIIVLGSYLVRRRSNELEVSPEDERLIGELLAARQGDARPRGGEGGS